MSATAILYTPIDEMVARSKDGKLVYLGFALDGSLPREGGDEEPAEPDQAVFETTQRWLERYFAGDFKAAPPVSEPFGTEFQLRVWDLANNIAPGQIATYGELARAYERAYGKRTGARAVGSAVRANPLCLIIPTHRVVGSDGGLTGFYGGVWLKRLLLEHEGVLDPTKPRSPCRVGRGPGGERAA